MDSQAIVAQLTGGGPDTHTHTYTCCGHAPTLGQISQVSDVSMNQPVKSLVNANSSSSDFLWLAWPSAFDRVTTTATMSYSARA